LPPPEFLKSLASNARGDLPDPTIPSHQLDYLRRLKEDGCKLIVLWFGGSPLILGDLPNIADALLWVGYPGEAGGEAIAQIAFGKAAPSGKLPFTLYQSIEDLPPFEDYSMKGRTYRYFEKEPAYPFGYGLSYADFEYSDLRIPEGTQAGKDIPIQVDLTNHSHTAAEEVVQVYVRPVDIDMQQVPQLALKGFQRIPVIARETKTLSFNIEAKSLRLVTEGGNRVFIPGQYEIIISSYAPMKGTQKLKAPRPISARTNLHAQS